MTKRSIFTRGIIKENPVLVLLLGLCPVLAVTTQVESALGMGAASTFVLLGANVMISLLRKVIPNKVRIPCFIVVISSFTVLAKMIIEAYAYSLYQSLGIFLPLITVNCMILARAEIFASRNKLTDSVLDALGTGIGFTLALVAIATIREIFGNGSWFGLAIPWLNENKTAIFTLMPGAFIVLAILLAVVNSVTKGQALRREAGCAGCPGAAVCGKTCDEAGEEKGKV